MAKQITKVATYPTDFGGAYQIAVSGAEDKVDWVLRKLEYFALNELNDEDLADVDIEESFVWN